MEAKFTILLPFNYSAVEVINALTTFKRCINDKYKVVWLCESDNYQGLTVEDSILSKAYYRTPINGAGLFEFITDIITTEYLVYFPIAVNHLSPDLLPKLAENLNSNLSDFTIAKLANANREMIDNGFTYRVFEPSEAVDVLHPSVDYDEPVAISLLACSMYKVSSMLHFSTHMDAVLAEPELSFLELQLKMSSNSKGGRLTNSCYTIAKKNQSTLQELQSGYTEQLSLSQQNTLSDIRAQNRKSVGKVLMIDMHLPSPDKDAGSYAAYQEIKLLQSIGYDIAFCPITFEAPEKYKVQLKKHGVEVLCPPFYSDIQSVIDDYVDQVNAVYITRYNVATQCIDNIKSKAPELPIIFNNADLHFLREMRSGFARNDSNAIENAKITRDIELGVMDKTDAILSYNEAEHLVISSHLFNQNKVFKCPWVLTEKPKGPKFEERDGIAFLGGYGHAPNVEAIEFFVRNVMPLLGECASNIKLYVYGSNMPESFKQLETNNVKLVGYVENLDDLFFKHRVFVAPLLSGAGIKGKVLEAISYGVPCVLSGVAAEATGLVHQKNALIAKEPKQWVEAINTLYRNKELWTEYSESVLQLAGSHYSLEHGQKLFKDVFDYLKLPILN